MDEIDIVNYSELTWTTGEIKIQYPPDLDAGGTLHASILARYLKDRFNTSVESALEAFSGPGFIGFHLITEGIANKMTFIDINPIAIESVLKTIQFNKLVQQCSAYCGNNLDPLPAEDKFNLVVGNPPWSFKSQVDANGLIESDPGWHIHRAFYEGITKHLHLGGMVVLLEWKPYEIEPSGSGRKSWDIRPRPPQFDFQEMMEAGGLRHIETVPLEGGWHGLHAVVSMKINE